MTLKELLKDKGITQEHLVTEFFKYQHYKYRQQVSEWLIGKRLPDLMSVYYMSLILCCSIDMVFNAVLSTQRQCI